MLKVHLLFSLCVTLTLAAPCLAQDASLPTEPSNVVELLQHVKWDADKLGPLLVVDPAGAKREDKSQSLAGEIPPTALADVLPAFKRKLFRVGGVNVIAPIEMSMINDPSKYKPDPLANMSMTDKF